MAESTYHEPVAFRGIPFGASKEQVEQLVTFTDYTDNPGALIAFASTNLTFGGVSIRASLDFERGQGLQAIHGGFPSADYTKLKAVFIRDFGPPHDIGLEFRGTHIHLSPSPFGRRLGSGITESAPVESVVWYGPRVFVALQDRIWAGPFGQLHLATYRTMKRDGLWKMNPAARKALVMAGELVTPPPHWPQEPTGFEGLEFGMVPHEVGLVLGLAPPPLDPLYHKWELSFSFASTRIAIRLDFSNDRLCHIGGTFDIADFETVRSAFVERYGPPHHTRVATAKGFYWSSDWIVVCLVSRSDTGTFWFAGTTDPPAWA